ncbi:uncharacterized protein LOC130657662 [Hydractinia symbiolongicarpus]|uniref:uncharacterized protein LOC130657662 n=1 Tax=Hydractinia symbiolongicarpus TaxID=13093 RepID=UPI0025501550|nr:uncharacterized protein LOC130657662 [Hydractinia symbiolongicarpus]
MFSILIGYSLFVKCVINAHVDVSVTQLPNNGTIITRTANFRKIPHFHSHFSIWVDRVESVLACAAKCMTNLMCRSFSAQRTGHVNCALLDGTLATNHYYIHKNYFYDHYEMQNMCTLNPFICEHGSVCFPNFDNNTYYCDWCFPPYYGAHCNLTDSDAAKTPIPTEISQGIRASCETLRENFKISDENIGYYDIYPWRDMRKLKVACQGGWIRILNIASSQNGSTNHHTVTKLGNLRATNFRVTTTVLNMLYKLIGFKKFRWVCQRNNSNVKNIEGNHKDQSIEMLKYLIGETNELPRSCNSIKYKNIPVECHYVVNKSLSSTAVPYESRNYREIIKFGPGGNITFSAGDGIFGCLDEPGDYMANDLYEIWVR